MKKQIFALLFMVVMACNGPTPTPLPSIIGFVRPPESNHIPSTNGDFVMSIGEETNLKARTSPEDFDGNYQWGAEAGDISPAHNGKSSILYKAPVITGSYHITVTLDGKASASVTVIVTEAKPEQAMTPVSAGDEAETYLFHTSPIHNEQIRNVETIPVNNCGGRTPKKQGTSEIVSIQQRIVVHSYKTENKDDLTQAIATEYGIEAINQQGHAVDLDVAPGDYAVHTIVWKGTWTDGYIEVRNGDMLEQVPFSYMNSIQAEQLPTQYISCDLPKVEIDATVTAIKNENNMSR
jgi:hypothetical protein